jgi:hypothetical protein
MARVLPPSFGAPPVSVPAHEIVSSQLPDLPRAHSLDNDLDALRLHLLAVPLETPPIGR